jgi:hypothetical protein
MRRERLVRTIAASLVLAIAPGLTPAEERAKDPKETPRASPTAKAEAASDEAEAARPRYDVRADDVITNEDLERMMAGLSPLERRAGVYTSNVKPASDEAPAETAPGAPAAKAEPGTAGKPAVPPGVADAEGRVAALQTRVSELEKAVLAVKNPLLPRGWTTPDSSKERDAESGYQDLDNASRLAQREAELRSAREELEQARQDLAELRGSSPAP